MAKTLGSIRFMSKTVSSVEDSSTTTPVGNTSNVVIAECHATLEWTLHSPPPIHQFEESPIVVETFGPKDPFHDH